MSWRYDNSRHNSQARMRWAICLTVVGVMVLFAFMWICINNSILLNVNTHAFMTLGFSGVILFVIGTALL